MDVSKDIKNITTIRKVASYLDVPLKQLTFILYKKTVDEFYNTFQIPKKDGTFRTINSPTGILKGIQKNLAVNLYNYDDYLCNEHKIIRKISHGFERNKDIISNAKIHRNKRYVINLDLENFFDSFNFGRVKGFFEKNKYFLLEPKIAIIFAQLTCYKGSLPQGAPSSPIITNFICRSLDFRLYKLAKQYKLDYTRYADDLTFSTNHHNFLIIKDSFFKKLEKIINRSGFNINKSKTRICYKTSNQTVTGLTVNKNINVNYKYYKTTIAMAHSLYSKGNFYIDNNQKVLGTMDQLEGRFNYIYHVWRQERNLPTNAKTFFDNKENLNNRFRHYERFIFYKYFYNNKLPLIITEGKTDPLYIKAALKNLYKRYPNLITKTSENEFIFHCTFLKRTSRFQNFFGLYEDGADSMMNIYHAFLGKKNIFEFFKKFKQVPKSPVILLFDNELDNRRNEKRPLQKLLGLLKKDIKKNCDNSIRNIGFFRFNEDVNLYLLVIPNLQQNSNKHNIEIEDLFDNQTLSVKLQGKTFCRDSSFDKSKNYGKNELSIYVEKHFLNINFEGFTPLLDNLNKIVLSWKELYKV